VPICRSIGVLLTASRFVSAVFSNQITPWPSQWAFKDRSLDRSACAIGPKTQSFRHRRNSSTREYIFRTRTPGSWFLLCARPEQVGASCSHGGPRMNRPPQMGLCACQVGPFRRREVLSSQCNNGIPCEETDRNRDTWRSAWQSRLRRSWRRDKTRPYRVF